jgi:hypothetical protein
MHFLKLKNFTFLFLSNFVLLSNVYAGVGEIQRCELLVKNTHAFKRQIGISIVKLNRPSWGRIHDQIFEVESRSGSRARVRVYVLNQQYYIHALEGDLSVGEDLLGVTAGESKLLRSIPLDFRRERVIYNSKTFRLSCSLTRTVDNQP